MARDCLALGWQVSLLARQSLRAGGAEGFEMPVGELSPSELLEVGLGRVIKLLESLAVTSERVAGTIPRVEDVRHDIAYSAEESSVRRALYDLHTDLLAVLSGVEERCATAYRLGRSLADTSVAPQTLAQLQQHFASQRAASLCGWLDELRGLLPDDAADAVAYSIRRWETWVAGHAGADLSEADGAVAAAALERQGRTWRAVLTGDRAAVDLLEPEDYEEMAAAALARTRSVAAQAARIFVVPLLAAVALFGFGVALVVAWSGGARAVAGLGAMVIAVVLAWRFVAALLGPVTDRLEGPIWQAERSRALARRLTTLPPVAAPAPDAPRPIRITRRHVVRETAFPGNPSEVGPEDTTSGEAFPIVFGPPVPRAGADEPIGSTEVEEGESETLRLETASRAPGRRH